MKKIVKWILIILIIVGTAAGAFYYKSLPMPVEATELSPKTAELYFIEQGVNKENTVVEVYSILSGRIESLNVAEDQRINAGDVICMLDSADYSYQIHEMQSNIKGYNAQIANLGLTERKEKDSLVSTRENLLGQMKSLEAEETEANTALAENERLREEQIRMQNIVIVGNEDEVARARENLRKSQILYDNGTMSHYDFEEAQKAVDNADIALEQSKQQLQLIQNNDAEGQAEYFEGMRSSINAQITGIDSAMGKSYTGGMTQYYNALIDSSGISIQMLNKKIEDCTIKSPVTGTITKLNIKDSNIVNAQLPLAEIVTEKTGDVEVYVSTGDIGEVNVGDSVGLTVKRRQEDIALSGTVLELDDEAVVKLSALGVEERKVKVTIRPEANDILKPGFDVDVKFTFYREENKITVPKTALFVSDGRDMVWVVRDGLLDTAEVTKGMELRTETVIESGVNTGEFVVTDANVDNLRKGAKVKLG